MQKLLERVAVWNSKRYDQKYSHSLQAALIKEEVEELLEAETEVEFVDAIGDIAFVAAGAFWKLNMTYNEVEKALNAAAQRVLATLDIGLVDPRDILACTAGNANSMNPADFAATCFVTAHTISTAMNLNFRAVLGAICDSNDTKSIKKTDHTKKANAGDKGTYYVAPTVALQKLLDERVAKGPGQKETIH